MFDQVWGYYSSTITENIQVLDLKSEDTLVRINSETVIQLVSLNQYVESDNINDRTNYNNRAETTLTYATWRKRWRLNIKSR